MAERVWPRPVPTIGDQTSAAMRAGDPAGWAFPEPDRDALARIMSARRDIRRFRPDPVDDDTIDRILRAAHSAPSVGHSQPWRFVVVSDPATRAQAAVLADRARLSQAVGMDPESARHLLDLDLEGIREAPVGLVVCCDRRVAAAGVLGRATFHDADMWSCACAIQNLWLAARAEGLGVGWVTLFQPDELAGLVSAPAGVETLGWLCVGWPDERPPTPGLERRGWSQRLPVDDFVLRERWPAEADQPAPPVHRLAPPSQLQVVAAHDSGDQILSAPGSLGILDRAVDRAVALGINHGVPATLVLAAADHPVVEQGVSAYPAGVTRHVVEAALAGSSVGAVAALAAGVDLMVVDAGVEGAPVPGVELARPRGSPGNLVDTDALTPDDVDRIVRAGREAGSALGGDVVCLGEIGVGNTTVAAALASGLLDLAPELTVGLGSGSDTSMLGRKRQVVEQAVARAGRRDPMGLLGALGGGEIAFLTGVVLGVAGADGLLVLDGMATGVAALVAVLVEPAAASHLVAGQRSREAGHAHVLQALGLEPLLDLRLRAGEGAGAVLAWTMLRAGLAIRLSAARTTDSA